MKKIKSFLLLLIAVFLFSACSAENINKLADEETVNEILAILEIDEDGNTNVNNQALLTLLGENADIELNTEETEGIKFMLEEEKLARDVYAKLYEIWNQNTFNNIAQSEATHIMAVKALALKYNLDIDFYNDEKGVFSNEEIATLYTELSEKGENSLTEALEIGALIEEIDISDLEKYLGQSENSDIELVYENLMKGSRNHLRSFVKTINRQGQEYEAKVLEQEDYEEIINLGIERGSYSQGNGQGGNGAGRNSR